MNLDPTLSEYALSIFELIALAAGISVLIACVFLPLYGKFLKWEQWLWVQHERKQRRFLNQQLLRARCEALLDYQNRVLPAIEAMRRHKELKAKGMKSDQFQLLRGGVN
jgi:two-component SAPR family response regulator